MLTTARQLGAALGVAIFVAVAGARPASDLAGLDHSWIVVLITAAMTAAAGLATGRRSGHRPHPMTGGRPVMLRDGSKVLIRQVQSADAPLLVDGFTRLSAESRRMRFLRRKDELTAAELRYLTDIDHHDHEALGALDEADGRGVGVARYVRDADDQQTAEIALTIVDDWQGRGLGSELLTQLRDHARQAGIRRLTALVSADNATMTRLLRSAGATHASSGQGTVEYEIALVPREATATAGVPASGLPTPSGDLDRSPDGGPSVPPPVNSRSAGR